MTTNFRKIVLLCGFILLLSAIVCARPDPKICRKRNGAFPRPGTSCRGYYECKNFVPVERTCAEGENFNANKGRCDWEDLYRCLEKQRDKECLKENGLFLKPGTNCKKYYRCCNGKAKVEACPSDLLFDPSKGNCEWPDLYTCVESISTTEKVSSTVTIFSTSTPSPKTPTDPEISNSTIQKTTPSNRITYSTHDPDGERTNSRILETSTKLNTQSTPAERQSTSETPAVSQTSTNTISATSEVSTPQSTTTEISTISEVPTSQSTMEISTTSEVPTPQSTTTEISTTNEVPTSQSTTTEISTSSEVPTTQSTTTEMSTTSEVPTSQSTMEMSTSEVPTTQSTTSEISTSQPSSQTSTIQPTTSEISIISQTTSPQMSSTHSTDHTILKENKEGNLTEPTIFETSTAGVTTSTELNIMCPEPNGYFPHPTDKHKFVGCVSNIPYILTCPSNLVYKHKVRRCERE